jgi:hypothetical protein
VSAPVFGVDETPPLAVGVVEVLTPLTPPVAVDPGSVVVWLVLVEPGPVDVFEVVSVVGSVSVLVDV